MYMQLKSPHMTCTHVYTAVHGTQTVDYHGNTHTHTHTNLQRHAKPVKLHGHLVLLYQQIYIYIKTEDEGGSSQLQHLMCNEHALLTQ